MLQQITANTAAQFWAISSMFFFMAVFVVVVFLVLGKSREELDHCSSLPLDDDPPVPRDDADSSAHTSKQGQ